MYSLIANVELLSMTSLLVILLFCFNLRYWRSKLLNPLSFIYLMVLLGCWTEIAAFLADGKPGLIWLNYLSNILYLGSIGVMATTMLVYCNGVFPTKIWKSFRGHLLWMLPLMVELAVLASAPWSGLIFRVDEAGCYHRASTFYIQFIPYGYLLVSTVLGIHHFRRAQLKAERASYLAIALFALPPFLLGGIQLLVPANALDVLEFSVVISLIANYAVSQNNRITRDTLTHLPNREVLDVILQEKMRGSRREKNDRLFVLMGDLDDFKTLNDTYGHMEGDRALVLAADVLYKVTAAHGAAAARFGGDEFVLVVEAPDASIPELIVSEIDVRLRELSRAEDFSLAMSFGCTEYSGTGTIADLLRAADKELYALKRQKKLPRTE